MGQERLSGPAMINICIYDMISVNQDISRRLSYVDIIDDFRQKNLGNRSYEEHHEHIPQTITKAHRIHFTEMHSF